MLRMLYFSFCFFGVSLNKELSIVVCVVLIMYFLVIVIFKLLLVLNVMLGYVE